MFGIVAIGMNTKPKQNEIRPKHAGVIAIFMSLPFFGSDFAQVILLHLALIDFIHFLLPSTHECDLFCRQMFLMFFATFCVHFVKLISTIGFITYLLCDYFRYTQLNLNHLMCWQFNDIARQTVDKSRWWPKRIACKRPVDSCRRSNFF